ncbi:hypothetical protein AVEN_158827-2 [Araneus ventricosus]|uniref:EGF-like domain-containing protein n=1 Tax=Araneus ventricosus TaxID=182803 RepID=A0A4Y2TWN9_ARAVE|nr:hypothetical protein AVEN_158827-2 [Araneus ventricosus]
MYGCSTDKDCPETQKCVENYDWKTCKCADGLSGNDCEKNDWCKETGKFKDCKGENGRCEYSKEKRSVVCTCATGKKLHPKENKCKDACSTNTDCTETQRCVLKDGWQTCKCADGLSGNDCEKNDWCQDPGKFKDCKGENGTCEYSKEKRSVLCTCAPGKKVHPKENICKETCNDDTECKYEGKCERKIGGNKFCSCNLGLTGDKCQTVFDCSPSGKYKGCENSGGKCKFDGSKALKLTMVESDEDETSKRSTPATPDIAEKLSVEEIVVGKSPIKELVEKVTETKAEDFIATAMVIQSEVMNFIDNITK